MPRVLKRQLLVRAAARRVYPTAFAPHAESIVDARITKTMSKSKPKIGVDLMGSDRSPQELADVLSGHSEVEVIGIVTHEAVPSLPEGLSLISTDSAIEMDESPLLAVRRKRDSTMAVGMRLVKEGELDAFVTTGNTGALVATAMLNLPMLPDIERPALLARIPTEKGKAAVLDVGANIAPKAHQLVDYARLGIAFRRAMGEEDNPNVGLLNIGIEEEKGTRQVKEIYSALHAFFEDSPCRFLGNIEGREVFQGKVDVLLTDGFTGNVFLKTCEGASQFLLAYLEKNFSPSEVLPLLQKLHQQFNYTKHPGGLLCGVDGIVIKCHGDSNVPAVRGGIQGAVEMVKLGLIEKMRAQL